MSATTLKTSTLLSEDLLTDEQNTSVDKLFEKDQNFLIAPTGGGKTVVTLTACSALLKETELTKILIICPLKVAQTAWQGENMKWKHLTHLTVKLAIGTIAERIKAIDSDADIVVINNENVPWLFKAYGHNHKFDGLVIDESSKWRSTGGAQFRSMRSYLKDFTWRLCMSATPVAEDWTGLFGQMLIVDQGERLGRNKDTYLRTYFYPTDYEQRNWAILPGKEAELAALIADVVHVMPDYKHTLPELTIEPVLLDIPDEAMSLYQELQREMAIDIGSTSIEAPNMAVVGGKLHQIASGFLYDEEKNIIDLHDVKIDWLRRRVEYLNGKGLSVMIPYWYQADLEKLESAFPEALFIGSGMKKGDMAKVMDAWQLGESKVLLIHPGSASHGVDGLQFGGHHIIWYGPVWSRDLFTQTIDRLHRRGQVSPVEVEVLLMKGTIDEIMLAVVEGKAEYHELFLEHLGERL